jgi:protein-S-isoprenylcysteine O-methyltransferase Ste14
MALREEFRRSGDWLFRWRSYVPLVPLVLVLGTLATGYSYPAGSHLQDQLWELACLAISLTGLGVRVATVGFVPAHTSGRNTSAQLASTLNTTGMYSVVRHPLYVGNFLMWLGIALFPRSILLLLVIVLFFWLYYERIMFAEEEFLRERFGATFEAWAARTPAFVPKWGQWTSPALAFSLRTVLRRELSSFFGLIATFAGAEAASDYGATGKVELDLLWVAIFLTALAIFLALRFLKRRTALLQVQGR